MVEPKDRRKYPPELDIRVSLLEQWKRSHDEWAGHQSERLDTLWDWRAEVRPVLATTNRLLWAVLTTLLADLGTTVYLLFTRH